MKKERTENPHAFQSQQRARRVTVDIVPLERNHRTDHRNHSNSHHNVYGIRAVGSDLRIHTALPPNTTYTRPESQTRAAPKEIDNIPIRIYSAINLRQRVVREPTHDPVGCCLFLCRISVYVAMCVCRIVHPVISVSYARKCARSPETKDATRIFANANFLIRILRLSNRATLSFAYASKYLAARSEKTFTLIYIVKYIFAMGLCRNACREPDV